LFEIEKLDIVITRSCQLNCSGCLTFSNHNLVKGHVDLTASLPWLEFWSSKLKSKTVHVFGGEPLMHPDWSNWVRTVSTLFCKHGIGINMQTNGIKISAVDYNLLYDLIHNYNLQFNITVHSQESWYQEKINQGIKILESIAGVGAYTEINSTERVFNSDDGWRSFRITDGTANDDTRRWVSHYLGHGATLRPGREFDHFKHIEHHGFCEAKEYIQLYEGSLYKCPPMAVLEDTLARYNYPNREQWEPWLAYQPLPAGAADETIAQWLTMQSGPEKYCNMCFGEEPPRQTHTIKVKYKDD